MDNQDVIMAMAEEAALKWNRREKRQMRKLQRAVREKDRERASLKRKKEDMVAKEAAKQKVVDEFMPFFVAIANNDMETAQNFDETAMMNTIRTTLNDGKGHAGHNAD
ncbi:hypothetical protein ES332_D13G206600v1 [Gossypium tomentosum]|uniref:Uncharacterized protein n=2 Tax=Gossypium tomentosum TaxID=34277 RepID=A0A5D2HZV3_GOSTO|nr:hypothetical protein ES332_D13G206600v1 [Gossypium tomentosum]